MVDYRKKKINKGPGRRGRQRIPVAKTHSPKRMAALASGEGERLQKVLASLGLGSRRKIDDLIAIGQVLVNQETAQLGQRVLHGDMVRFEGKRITIDLSPKMPKILIYHKPEGEIVSRDDPKGRPSIFDRLPKLHHERWIPVGRLDFNTCGLLLLTTSGQLADCFMHPRNQIDRQYAVRIRGMLTDNQIQRLREGVMLEEGLMALSDITGPFSNEEDNKNQWYHIVLQEGKNREVRRLFAAINANLTRLMRVRYGTVFLPQNLRRGCIKELTKKEVEKLIKDNFPDEATALLKGEAPKLTTDMFDDTTDSTNLEIMENRDMPPMDGHGGEVDVNIEILQQAKPEGSFDERPKFGAHRAEKEDGELSDRPRFGKRDSLSRKDFDDRPRRDSGDRPRFADDRGNRSNRGGFGDRPRGNFNDRPRSNFDDRPRRDSGDRPKFADDRGNRSDRGGFGDRPRGNFNDRPRSNFDDRPRRDSGDRPRFADDRGNRSNRGGFGDRPRGNFNDRPRRDSGDRPKFADDRGNRSDRGGFGDRPRGNFNDRPRRDSGDRPKFADDRGNRSDRGGFGDRPRGNFNDRPRSNFDDRPRRDSGDRPKFADDRGNRSDRGGFGDRPRGNFNDRPRSNFNDRPRRDSGDRPKFADDRGNRSNRGGFGDRPRGNFNDRPRSNFDDRPRRDSGDRPRFADDRGNRSDRGGFGDRPRRDSGDRPRSNFDDRPRRESNDRPGFSANTQDRPPRPFGERGMKKAKKV